MSSRLCPLDKQKKHSRRILMKKTVAGMFAFFFVIFAAVRAYPLCVKAEKAVLRDGPGTNYAIRWEAYKYMPFVKVGTSVSGEWYAVKDIDGDVAWIHKKLLTSRYRCAVVKRDEVNVRTGPGTRYSKSSMSPAQKYYSFKIIKKGKSWVKVQDEWGNRGWIYRNYLWIR